MLADPCADPGIFARVVQARLPENSSDNGFCLFFVLNFYSFTVAYHWFISNRTIILQGFVGAQPIQGGGRGLGVKMLILETHRTFGGADPLFPLWIRTCDHLRGSGWGGVWYSLFIKNLAHYSSH